jgi:hypothetical protein
MVLDSSDNRQPLTSDVEPAEHELAPKQAELDNKRRQRLRSLAIAWALFAMAVMFFLVTIVRLGANVANRPF